MTGTLGLYGSAVVAATLMKDRIYSELGFTVNVGVSTNKILAKMASDFKKPNLVHTLFPEEIERKMWVYRWRNILCRSGYKEKTLCFGDSYNWGFSMY